MTATRSSSLREVDESIWKVESSSEGPILLVLGGVHGNELTGIEVVKTLLEAVQTGGLSIQHGGLVLALGNLEAIGFGTRGTEDRNLNRMFNPERLKQPPDGTHEDSRARALRPFLEEANVMLDIHSTNIPSVPFISSQISERHERVYRWLGCDRVVADPSYVLAGEAATTDEFVDLAGGIGICYESGQSADVSQVGRTVASVLDILVDIGICAEDARARALHATTTTTSGSSPAGELRRQVTYRLVDRILLTPAGFRWADDVGGHYFQALKPGDLIGYHGDVEVRAEASRVIVFPALQQDWEREPVCCLAIVDESGDGRGHTPASPAAGP